MKQENVLHNLTKKEKIKKQQGEIDDNKISINYGLILNAIGVTVAVINLYYVRKECEKSNVKEEKPQTKEKPQKVLDTFE